MGAGMPECGDMLDVLRWQRRRIAARLHDGPIQDLTAAHLFLDAAGYQNGGAGAAVSGATRNVRAAMTGARGLMRDLAEEPSAVLAAERLADLAGTFQTQADVSVPRAGGGDEAQGDGRVDTVAWILLLVAEELLSNVRRHAGGVLTGLRVGAEGDRMVLEVTDAGPGGCPATMPEGRMGLRGVHALARACGGTVAVESGEEGTRVRVEVPV
jgi:signal transduction histidine kinase